jgi:type IV pilus assembly protein PilE
MLGPNRSRGFSLIELMVVVAIAAILLSVAIPSYREYLRRGAVAEAIGAIGGARVVMEQYFLDNRTYVGAPCPANTKKFTITCTTDVATYTITATGTENVAGFVYTIDQADTRTTTGPWVTGTVNCWINRKGDSC